MVEIDCIHAMEADVRLSNISSCTNLQKGLEDLQTIDKNTTF